MPSAVDLPQQERSGYSAPIRQSVIEIPGIHGVPRNIFLSWVGICVLAVGIVPWPRNLVWRLICIALIWGIMHGVMMWASRKDPQWPELSIHAVWDGVCSLFRSPDVLDY